MASNQSVHQSLRLKVTDACNLSCRFCHKEGGSKSTPVTISQVRQIADFASRNGFGSIHLTGGEPTLHSDLDLLVKEVKKYDLVCALTTNGQFDYKLLTVLRDAGLDSLNFSVHTVRPSAWSQIQKNVDKQIAAFKISHTLVNIEEAVKLGFLVKINTVVGDDPELAIEVVNALSQTGVHIRLLDVLGSRISKMNIQKVLNHFRAKKTMKTRNPYSSKACTYYRLFNGETIVTKILRLYRLPLLCEGCQLKCLEGFYGLRIESDGDDIYVRLCLQRNDSQARMKLEQFVCSDMLTEITKISQ